MNNSIYILISTICKPHIYIKNILGISKRNGYKTCPFDLYCTPYITLLKYIQDNFKHCF